MAHYVYLLECGDGTLYTGWTTNLEQRVAAHNRGQGAKYTRARLPVKLVYSELYTSKSQALRRECAIKRLTRREKLALCAGEGAGETEMRGNKITAF